MKSASRIPILSSNDPRQWDPRDQMVVGPFLRPRILAALIHGEPTLSALSTLDSCISSRTVLQTTKASSVLQEAISYDIPLQNFSKELPVHLGKPNLLVIDENRGFLDAQKKKKPSLLLEIRLLKKSKLDILQCGGHRHKSLCTGQECVMMHFKVYGMPTQSKSDRGP